MQRALAIGRTLDEADEARKRLRKLADQLLERRGVLLHEAGAIEQIARRIAGQRQLREDRQAGAPGGGLSCRFDHPL